MRLTAPRRHIIAIDGPAASGKSTTAAAVADRLGFIHLNSGLLYRAFAWRALREGCDPCESGFDEHVRAARIGLEKTRAGLRVLIDGEEPGKALLGQDVASFVSSVASVRSVRAEVLTRLRAAGESLDLVCDGRDIGTTVFPRADLKIFLVADPYERARRRLLDLGVEPGSREIAEEAQRLERRDRADETRELSPLRKATDAVEIDTTERTAGEVVEAICSLAAARGIGVSGTRG